MTTITDERIEAAAKALYEFAGDGELWEDAPAYWKDTSRKKARAALTAAAQAGKPERDARQVVVFEWGKRAFGWEQMSDKVVRSARMIEEAAELAQACGLPKDHAQRALDHVYSRPAGDPQQEAGGVGVTLMALCQTLGLSADECERVEVARCLSKPIEHFAARNQVKVSAVDNPNPAPATPGRADDWQLVPKALRDEIDNLIKVWQDAPSGVSFGRYMENALSKLCAERDKLALAASPSPPATPGGTDDKWRASLEEAREYVRNLWRNKALREREHYALIAILNDVERLAASPPPPAPTSEIERGMRQTYDVTGDVWFKFAADHIATLTKELAEARKVIEPFGELKKSFDAEIEAETVMDWDEFIADVAWPSEGECGAARDWQERNKATGEAG